MWAITVIQKVLLVNHLYDMSIKLFSGMGSHNKTCYLRQYILFELWSKLFYSIQNTGKHIVRHIIH